MVVVVIVVAEVVVEQRCLFQKYETLQYVFMRVIYIYIYLHFTIYIYYIYCIIYIYMYILHTIVHTLICFYHSTLCMFWMSYYDRPSGISTPHGPTVRVRDFHRSCVSSKSPRRFACWAPKVLTTMAFPMTFER